MAADVEKAAGVIRVAERVTVLTGAGISTESGIPDFRGPKGVWTKDPAAQVLSTIENYLADPEVRRRAWQARMDTAVWLLQPNAGHFALTDLERSGRLRGITTQNVDGLHQAAGSSPELVIEIHGTAHWVVCLSCGRRTPMPDVAERIEAGEADPPCVGCGGIQKSATVSFGQRLDPEVLAAAIESARDCDAFLAVGTSLTVHPAAGLCDEALSAGARLIIVNEQPTPYDADADAVVRDPISDVLPQLTSG